MAQESANMRGGSGSPSAEEDRRSLEEEEDDSIGQQYHCDEESFGTFDLQSSSFSSSSTAPSFGRPPLECEVEEIPSYRWLSQSFRPISGRGNRSQSAGSSNKVVEVDGNLLTTEKKKGSSGKGRRGGGDLFSRFWRQKRMVAESNEMKEQLVLEDAYEMEENAGDESNEMKDQLVFVDDGKDSAGHLHNHRIHVEDLLRGSAAVLGKGWLGTGYKATLESGYQVMIRRCMDSSPRDQLSSTFEIYVDLMRGIRHPNILRLIAFYNGKDEKLLVFDYLPRGSLRRCLHSNLLNWGNHEGTTSTLGWSERLNVAVGVARGLAHLHWKSKIAHGRIKSPNILLNEDGEACISDVGIGLSVRMGVNLNFKGFQAGKEENVSDNVTRENDVYAFGVLLMELVTGKDPLITLKVDELDDIIYLTRYLVNRNRAANAFDKRLLPSAANAEEMEAVLHLSVRCVQPLPEERPAMTTVQKMLERIRSSSTLDRVDQFPSTSSTSQPADASTLSSSATSSFLSSPPSSSPETGTKPDQTIETEFSTDYEEVASPIFGVASSTDNSPHVKRTGRADEAADETDSSSLGSDNSTPLVEERFDIGIPVGHRSSTGPVKTYHAPLIKGVVAGLHETLKANLHFDEVLQCVRSFTATLVMLGASLEDWNTLVQHVLRVVKQIDKLKATLAEYEADKNISSDIDRLQDEMVYHARTVEEDSAKLDKSREELAEIRQEKASVGVAIANLEKQLDTLREQHDTTKNKCAAIELEVKSLTSIVSQHHTELESLIVAVESTKEWFGQTELEKEKNKDAISTLLDSILVQVSSFSFQN